MKIIFIALLFVNLLFATSQNNYFQEEILTDEQKEFIKKHPIIKVSNEKDWAPYDYNENGKAKGYAIDYLKMLAEKIGVTFVFETNTWSNLIQKVKNKEIDLIHPLSYNEDRSQYLYFSKPFIKNIPSLVVATSTNDIHNLEDLKGKRVAVARGWNTTKFLKSKYPQAIFKEYNSSKELLEAVAFGEADATVDGYLTINYIKQRHLLNNLKIVNKVNISNNNGNLHIGVRKDWDIFAQIIDVAMQNINEEEMLALNEKWISVKNKKILLSEEEEQFLKENPKIFTRVSKDYYPFSFTQNDKAGGYIIDYTNLLGKKLGIEFIYVKNQSWNEAINDFKNRKLDVIPLMKETEERKNFANFTNPILETYVGIATDKEKIKTIDLLQLSGKKVATVRGYWFEKKLQEHYPDVELKLFKNNLDALKALKEKEVDAVVSTEPVLQYLIKENYFVNIATKPILNNPHFEKVVESYGVRKDWDILNDILRKAISSLTQDEVLTLKNKWFAMPENIDKVRKIQFSNEEAAYLKNKKRILMCVDPNWMPYEKIENKKHIGIFADYFNIFRELVPVPIQLVQTKTWTQTLEYARTRKCDIISSAVQTPQREKYLNFTKPYVKLPLVIATKPDKPFVAGINDILSHEIAVVKSYAYIELLKNKYPNVKLVEVDSISIGFKKVLSGEVYGFIDSLASVGNKIQKEYFGNVKIAGKLDEEFTIGIATRKDVPVLQTIFQKAVDTLSQDDHQVILNKWVSVKYDKSLDYSYVWKGALILLIVFAFFTYRQFLLKKQNVMLLQTQKQLQESIEEFEHLISSTIEAVFILEDNRVSDCNEEAIKMFGYASKQDIVGLSPFDAVEEEFHEQIKYNLQREFSEPYEVNGIKKDGTVFPILIKGHNFVRKNKNIRVTAILDLSELKHKEALLSEHTKMVALGEMLGNIAHQWRQPLSVISTAASGVKIQKEMGMLDDKVFDESMDGIINNANYLSKTIDDFRGFIHQDKQRTNFLLFEHLEKDLTILTGMLKLNSIEVVSELDKEIKIYNIENELTQAIINIINNSRDAFEENNIKTKYIFISTSIRNNKAVLSLRDNAGGIPKDIITKVFEPYFTTKHKRQGTGLGLYMTNQIITESMKGDIEVKNVEFEYLGKQYKGAEFIITLDL